MAEKINFTIKKDAYSNARGGKSVLLELVCSNCNQPLLIYQKDGPGILKRLYFDRIYFPENIAHLQETFSNSGCHY